MKIKEYLEQELENIKKEIKEEKNSLVKNINNTYITNHIRGIIKYLDTQETIYLKLLNKVNNGEIE